MRRKRAKRAGTAAQYAPLDCSLVCEGVVQELSKEGLVDDKYFSTWFVRQRTAGKHRSSAVLKAEMRMKGVENDVIGEAMEEEAFSNFEQCKLLAQKKADKMTREKLLVFLARKGFPYQLVQKVVDSLDRERAAGQLR
jgi:regulatory protein